jgi:uncharacterized protein DUF6176
MLLVAIRQVQPGQVDRLRSWLHELQERKEEVLETFRQETVRHEVAYLMESKDGPVLIYAMEAEDFHRASEAFKSSSLPIDAEHKKVMAEVLGDSTVVEKLYECELPPISE